jgi:hypothetical protein
MYSYKDFESFGSATLPEYVTNSLASLFASVGYTEQTVNTYLNQFSVNVPAPSSSSNSRIVQKASAPPQQNRIHKKAKAKEDEWKRPVFKATVFAELESNQVLINEVRAELNKINATNYEAKMPLFIEKITQIFDLVDSGDDVQMADYKSDIFKTLFDVFVSNKLFAKIYASTLVQLNDQFDFSDLFAESITTYLQSMHNIVDIDSNVDYDGFCELTTRNNNRKTITNLFCEIAKTDRTELMRPENIHTLVVQLVEHVLAIVKQVDKQKEVEEITENIVIIFSHFGDQFKAEFKSVFEALVAEKPAGLSSRTKFKYMDLIGK